MVRTGIEKRLQVAALAAMAGSGGLFWFQALVMLGAGLAGADLLTWTSADQRGIAHGWLHMYDLQDPYPINFSPPLVSWLYLPLLPLSRQHAYFVWWAVLIAGSILAWRLAAPGKGLQRALWLVALTGSLPLLFGIDNGQPLPLALLLVALALWLLRRGRGYEAGAALALAVQIKPTAALLVGPALLLSSDRRAFWGWLAASAFIVALYVAVMGPGFFPAYEAATRIRATAAVGLALPGSGIAGWLLPRVAIAAAALALTWRSRPATAVAVGIAASLLIAQVVHLYDLVLLFPVAWTVQRAGGGYLAALATAPGLALVTIKPAAPAAALLWEASLLAALALTLSSSWTWLNHDVPVLRTARRLVEIPATI